MIDDARPQGKSNAPDHTLRGVGQMMQGSADPFTVEVGLLVDYIGLHHEPPVSCDECRDDHRDRSNPCLMLENATSVAFAWLLRVIEERG